MAIRTFLAYTADAEDLWFIQNADGSLTISKTEFSLASMGKTQRDDLITIEPHNVQRLRAWLAGDNDPR